MQAAKVPTARRENSGSQIGPDERGALTRMTEENLRMVRDFKHFLQTNELQAEFSMFNEDLFEEERARDEEMRRQQWNVDRLKENDRIAEEKQRLGRDLETLRAQENSATRENQAMRKQ